MTFAETFLQRFHWIHGHADVLGLLADGAFLRAAADALAGPFEHAQVAKVAGIEARGFVLGTAVALRLDAGFVPIRKRGAIHPGPKAVGRTRPDWRGNESELLLQRAAVQPGERVLLVDDWVETASQAQVAQALIETCGGRWAGLSVLVDQMDEVARRSLEPVASVVAYDELPPSV